MPDHLFFVLGFAFLLTHEMDAIRAKEWRLFPVVSHLTDEAGYRVFTAAHVPLYALLFWGLVGVGAGPSTLILVLDGFFVVHLVLHVVRRHCPANHFASPFSWTLFVGAGMCGGIDLLLMVS